MTKGNVEIERRFFVKKDLLPPLPTGLRFRQGYMSEEPTVRIRVSYATAWITVKGPGRLSRREFEYPVPVLDAEEILTMCPHRLEKTRFPFHHDGHRWEVDEFLGRLEGLWIAEIELVAEDEQFGSPPWLGEEITWDARYSNASLARNGIPDPGKVRP